MRIRDEQLSREFGRLILTMITVSLRADAEEVKFGHPCSHLIEEAATKGVDVLAAELLERGDFAREFRLNGADLKVRWQWETRDGVTYLFVYIQNNHSAGRYTTTVLKLEELITSMGFAKESRR